MVKRIIDCKQGDVLFLCRKEGSVAVIEVDRVDEIGENFLFYTKRMSSLTIEKNSLNKQGSICITKVGSWLTRNFANSIKISANLTDKFRIDRIDIWDGSFNGAVINDINKSDIQALFNLSQDSKREEGWAHFHNKALNSCKTVYSKHDEQ